MNRLTLFTVGCLFLGVVAMVVLDLIWIGVILLFACIVAGVFLIADPEFLGREED